MVCFNLGMKIKIVYMNNVIDIFVYLKMVGLKFKKCILYISGVN